MRDAVVTVLFLAVWLLLFLGYYRLRVTPSERNVVHATSRWTLAILAVVVIAKYAASLAGAGYVVRRVIIYAIPAPLLNAPWYSAAIAGALLGLVVWYRRKDSGNIVITLTSLWLIFVLFALGVAGLRSGAAGIAYPFTRGEWEYVADARLISSIPEFLRSYVVLYPELSMHGKAHPPGNAILIHVLQRLLHVDTLGLALLIVAIGGTFVFPTYFFWKSFLPPTGLLAAMPIFILTPSLVMFSATCMDIVTVPFFWLALLLSVRAWRTTALLSFGAGLACGLASMLSFQFLPFGAVFIYFLLRLTRGPEGLAWETLLARAGATIGGFVAFHILLSQFTGYSMIENFRAAQEVHFTIVDAGAQSLGAYLLFAVMNVTAALIYLGIINNVLFARLLKKHGWSRLGLDLAGTGYLMIALLVLTGLYQAEVERIWLFVTPLFVPAIIKNLQVTRLPHGIAVALLTLQILVMETLFYTFW